MCLILGRDTNASEVKNDNDDDGDSDSEIVRQLQAEKETELKKSDVNLLYTC